MNLAQRDWEAGNLGRMVRLLEAHRPKAGEPDLRGWEWYYLWRLCHQELRTLSGPVASFSGLKVSADGTRIATGSEGGTVQVREVATSRLLVSLKGYPSFWFAPKGELVTGKDDGTVQFWDSATGRPLRSFTGHKQLVTHVDVTPDGKLLATASEDGTLKVWETASGRELHTLKGIPGRGTLKFSSGGAQLACSWRGRGIASQTTVKVWDTGSGRELRHRVWSFPPGISAAPMFSPDGSRLVVSDWPAPTIWDVNTGEELRIPPPNRLRYALIRPTFAASTIGLLATLPGQGVFLAASALHPQRYDSGLLEWDPPMDWFRSVVFSADGTRLATHTGSLDAPVKFWKVATGRELGRLNPSRLVGGFDMFFSPDGTQLVTTDTVNSEDWTLRVWGVESRLQENILKGHTSPIRDAVFTPDGTRLILATRDGSVKVWSVAGERGEHPLAGVPFARAWVVTPKRILVGEVLDVLPKRVRVSDLVTHQELFTWQLPKEGYWPGLTFSRDGARLTALWYNAPEKRWVPTIWDTATGKAVHHLPGLPFTQFTTAFPQWSFNPDCTRLATFRQDRQAGKLRNLVELWDVSTGQNLRTLETTEIVTNMVFSSDGMRIALGMSKGSVQLWDLAGKNEPRTLAGGMGGVVQSRESMAFSPDETCLAAAGYDGTVRIWEIGSGKVLHTLKGHTFPVWQVVFHPKGTRLVSADRFGTAKVWDVADGQELLTLKLSSNDLALLFDREGWRLFSSGPNEVQVHDGRPSSEVVQTEREASAVVTSLFGRLLTREEILTQLRGNPTISAAVRQQALALAKHYVSDPLLLRRGPVPHALRYRGPIWAVLHSRVSSPAQYRKALGMAGTEPSELGLRGMGQYRLGRYKEALATLGEVHNPEFPARFGLGEGWLGNREVALFFAMAQYQVGKKEQARATLTNFRKALLREELWPGPLDEADRALLREAAELIEGTPAAPKK
jgi:WD40 repeat protein